MRLWMLTTWRPLLATEAWRSFGQQFRGENAEFGWQKCLSLLAVGACFAFLFWVLRTLARRQETSENVHGPKHLFRALCESHALSRSERKLLIRLAKHYRLSSPVLLFVKPECFHAAGLPSKLANRAGALKQLRASLFQGLQLRDQ